MLFASVHSLNCFCPTVSVFSHLIIFCLFGSPQRRGCCGHVHTHTHTKLLPLSNYQDAAGCEGLSFSFRIQPFDVLPVPFFPHVLTRPSVRKVSWAANYREDVSLIRGVEPCWRTVIYSMKGNAIIAKRFRLDRSGNLPATLPGL